MFSFFNNKKLCGASAGMAACGGRILENHGRNQWFKLSSCKLVMQVLSTSCFWGQIVRCQTAAVQQNGATKLCRLKWAFLLTNFDDTFSMMVATTAACTWKITSSKYYCHNWQIVEQEADKRELYTDGCTYGCKLHLELFQSFIKKTKILWKFIGGSSARGLEFFFFQFFNVKILAKFFPRNKKNQSTFH